MDTLSLLLKYWRKLDKNRKSTDPILRQFHFRKQVRPHVSVRKGIIYHHLALTPWKIYAKIVRLRHPLIIQHPASTRRWGNLYLLVTPSQSFVYIHTQTQRIFNARTFFSIPPNFPFYWMSLMFYIRRGGSTVPSNPSKTFFRAGDALCNSNLIYFKSIFRV